MRSPCRVRAKTTVAIAAIPEAEARAPTPPSRAAIRCSKTPTVGFATRE